MPDVKITLITVSFNAERTIGRCIRSVNAQTYKNIEYIIIDGGSADQTLHIISTHKQSIQQIVSEPDKGIYDAMNKGIALATGDIIGMLNADDFFTGDWVLTDVARVFEDRSIEALYGDIDMINEQGKVVRRWRSGNHQGAAFKRGWMPPHPTFYCRRSMFLEHGNYRLDLGTAADYELMLRFIFKRQINLCYLPKVMVNMATGGASGRNLRSRLLALKNDFKAMRINHLPMPAVTVLVKRLRKLGQFF